MEVWDRSGVGLGSVGGGLGEVCGTFGGSKGGGLGRFGGRSPSDLRAARGERGKPKNNS